MKIEEAIERIKAEYLRARQTHPPMVSGHEGYAVILEELDELWDEIKQREPKAENVFREATQLGAMALAFLVEICFIEEVPDEVVEARERAKGDGKEPA